MWLATGQHGKSIEPGGKFHCDTCIKQRLYIGNQCKRFTFDVLEERRKSLLSESAYEPIKSSEPEAVKPPGLSRLRERINKNKQRLELKQARKSQVLADTDIAEKAIARQQADTSTVFFKEDGYNHNYCPVYELHDSETSGILEDILYLMEARSLPNDGGGLDQSAVYRVALMTISNERAAIKSEMEKAATDKAKSQANQRTSRRTPGRGRGRS